MQAIIVRHAHMPQGWVADLRLTVEEGQITEHAVWRCHPTQDHHVDVLLPALANLHSHSF